MNIWLKNTLRVLYFGWRESKKISQKDNVNKKRIVIYKDMISCFRKYRTLCSQYSQYELYKMTEEQKVQIGGQLKKENKNRDAWEDLYFKNLKFYNKYTCLKWDTSSFLRSRRVKAYTKRFGFGKNCYVQYGVKLICEHESIGKLTIGNNVLFAREVDIDYTADLTVGDGTLLSENVKILTHKHLVLDADDKHGLLLTPLIIQDHVQFGARVLVLPGVNEIGRGAFLTAGAVIRKSVPPYAIVTGNPAKIVGFRFTPEQIIEYEEEKYPVEDRIPIDVLENNYKKYFLDRISEVKTFLN